MAKLIKRLSGVITVQNRSFMIMDDDGASNRPDNALSMDDLAAQLNGSTSWFVATANLAMIASEDSWHVAEVVLEWWEDKPSEDDDQWTKSHTEIMYSSSGKLMICNILGDRSKRILDLKERDVAWCVRATFRPGPGRRKAPGRPPKGIESYRFQFWRATES